MSLLAINQILISSSLTSVLFISFWQTFEGHFRKSSRFIVHQFEPKSYTRLTVSLIIVYCIHANFFLKIQTKLHDTVCSSRTTATIATHSRSSLTFPLVYSAKSPNEAKITPLGSTTEVTAAEYVTKLKEKKEIEEKKKKRQQQSGVYRYFLFSKFI